MSEELAHKLQQEEDEQLAAATLLRRLPAATATATTVAAYGDDDDLALAMRLQAEFDREVQQLQYVLDESDTATTSLAVPARLAWLGAPPVGGSILDDAATATSAITTTTSAAAADDDSDDDDGAAPAVHGNDTVLRVRGAKQHHEVAKTAGRQSAHQRRRAAAGTGPTKHDPVVAAARHGKALNNRWFTQNLPSGNMERLRVPNTVYNKLREHAKRADAASIRIKSDTHAETHAQVLDTRTRLVLYRLLSNGYLTALHGVIATGKESAVYTGVCPVDMAAASSAASNADVALRPVAVKIFKTTLKEFKNRHEYMPDARAYGEAAKLSKQNPRKIVRMWAQKEFANLKRLRAAGIACPEPVLIKTHVLVMSLVGDREGNAAPQLRHVRMNAARLADAYLQVVKLMRSMFQDAGLVHGDLSEYNLLYCDGHVVVIDVSQAVENDSPNALEFLRRDCANMTQFFTRAGLTVMTLEQLFAFVADPSVADEDAYLERVQAQLRASAAPDDAAATAAASAAATVASSAEVQSNVFRRCHIPATLADLEDPFAVTEVPLLYLELISGLTRGEFASDEDDSDAEDDDDDDGDDDDTAQ